jgi:hypothetical protein
MLHKEETTDKIELLSCDELHITNMIMYLYTLKNLIN